VPTPEAIRYRLQEMLAEAIEIQAANYEKEAWRTGIPGAILKGRLDVLGEILDWMQGEESS